MSLTLSDSRCVSLAPTDPASVGGELHLDSVSASSFLYGVDDPTSPPYFLTRQK